MAAMRGSRLRARSMEVWDRLIASDPGLTRLTMAVKAVVGVGSGLGVEYLFATATGQAPLIAMLLGAIVAMLGLTGVADATWAGKTITLAFFPLVAGAGMTVGAVVALHKTSSLVVFVAVMFVAVWVRRFGIRSFIYGMLGWIGYFMAMFLHPRIAQVPSLLTILAVATAWTMVLVLGVFREDREKTLRRTLHAFLVRVREVASACVGTMDGASSSERQDARLRGRTAAVTEAALMIDGQLAHPAAVPEGWSAEAVRHYVLDAELAADALAVATPRLARIDGTEADAYKEPARRALAALAGGDLDAAEAAGRALVERTTDERGIADPHEDDAAAAAHRIGARVVDVVESIRGWSSPTRHEVGDPEEFEPAIELMAGNLPGTAATAADMYGDNDDDKPVRLLDRISLTTRQAVQVAFASGAAIVAGEALSSRRYYWAVIACFVAFTGTATTTETIAKALNRVTGTLVGLGAAILLAKVTAGHTWAVLAVILGCVFCGFYLLRVSYTLMIFFITIVIAQLYSVLRMLSGGLMLLRLEETAIGAAIGCAVALLVLPTRTRDTVSTAMSNTLEALQTLLGHVAEVMRDHSAPVNLRGDARAVDASLRQLLLLTRPVSRPFLLGFSGRGIHYRMAVHVSLAYYARSLAHTVLPTPPLADGLDSALAQACDDLAATAGTLAEGPARPHTGAVVPVTRLLDAIDMRLPDHASAAADPQRLLLRHLTHIDEALIHLATGPVPVPECQSPAGSDASRLIRGYVRGADGRAVQAVLTLTDLDGRQLDSALSRPDGGYHVAVPDKGVYLLVCTPRASSPTTSHTDRVRVDGRLVAHDIVLTATREPAP